jgi:folylpolyglutamate synthase/dihydropteroate synthase
MIQKHSTNNTIHSKYKDTYYQNTHTYTHPHITKQVKTTTVQDTRQPQYKLHDAVKKTLVSCRKGKSTYFNDNILPRG